jgi:hypothetical protein
MHLGYKEYNMNETKNILVTVFLVMMCFGIVQVAIKIFL